MSFWSIIGHDGAYNRENFAALLKSIIGLGLLKRLNLDAVLIEN